MYKMSTLTAVSLVSLNTDTVCRILKQYARHRIEGFKNIIPCIVVVINCAYEQMHIICKELQGIYIHNLSTCFGECTSPSGDINTKDFIQV